MKRARDFEAGAEGVGRTGAGVYVDELFVLESRDPEARRVGARRGHRWCHMWCDVGGEERLHEIAKAIGMRREWFQNKPGFPHYDLVPSRRERALALGVQERGLRDWLRGARPCGPVAAVGGPAPQLPALSIRGPWWWFILNAGKRLENRKWDGQYRARELQKVQRTGGAFLIHASLGLPGGRGRAEFEAACSFAASVCGVKEFPCYETMLRGGIVGRARVAEFVEASTDPWFMGPGALRLTDVEALPFQACRGALGFFNVAA